MLSQFLHDTREYFKKAPLLTEDKTYARILKIAENTQKCLNDLFSVNNISLKLIGLLKMRVDDVKYEKYKRNLKIKVYNLEIKKKKVQIQIHLKNKPQHFKK